MSFNRKKTFHLPNSDVKSSTATTTNESKSSPYRGLLLATVGAVFASFTAVIVKQVKNMHPGQLSVYRFLGVFVFSLPEAVKCQEDLFGPPDMRFLLIVRGIFGATNAFLYFFAYRYLPLGEASVIVFSLPVFVTLAARLLLKEPCGAFQTVIVLFTVAGIVLITKVPLKLSGHSTVYTKESIWGLLAAFGSLFFGTAQFIAIRKLKGVNCSIVMLYYGWVAVIETGILTAIVGNFSRHDCGLQSLLLFALGVFSYLGQALLTLALMCEMAGPVATVRAAVDIILAFLWQIFLFKDAPDLSSCIGAILVFLSVIFLGVKKWAMELPVESTCRRRLALLLK